VLTTVLLAATALAAGLTGTWSPCGFSMLSTLGPTGHTGGLRTTIAACATFAAGALAGGAATFTALSYVGRALGGGATAAAAGIAVAAAVGEARGVRVLPQVRRQVPEHWRRVMPLPLAGGLYGVLLGLGFTTFVLTLAVWALAGVSVALGDPGAGLAIGLAFGAGRALPVVALAPWIDGARGIRYAELMAERPAVLRALRLVDGLLLLACAAALAAGADSALAAGPPALVAAAATDPTLSGPALAWAAVPGGAGVLVDAPGAAARQLGGIDPALGGPYLAVADGPQVTVTAGDATVGQVAIPGVDAVAVAAGWLVARAPDAAGRSLLFAYPLPALGPARLVAAEPSGTDVGRPALDGGRLVVAINSPLVSRIVEFNLGSGRSRVLRRSRGSQLLNPALLGDRLLYERATYCDQRLVLGSPKTAAGAQVLLRLGGVAARDPGYEPGHTTVGSAPSRCPTPVAPRTPVTLWTTALGPQDAYVTELTPQAAGPPQASLFAVPLT
jgi:hypothetical protein